MPTPAELQIARDLLARYRNGEALNVTSLSMAIVTDETGERFALIDITAGHPDCTLFGFLYVLSTADLAALALASEQAAVTPDTAAISAQVFTEFPERN